MEILESIKAKNGQTLFLYPNEKTVQSIKRLIEQNTGHCPCKSEISEDTICPCKAVREKGDCCCGLYVKLLLE